MISISFFCTQIIIPFLAQKRLLGFTLYSRFVDAMKKSIKEKSLRVYKHDSKALNISFFLVWFRDLKVLARKQKMHGGKKNVLLEKVQSVKI